MTLMGYLVTSQTRRGLLEALFVREVRGSPSDLAATVGMSFSTVYRELREMEAAGLVRRDEQGAFRANTAPSWAVPLQQLLTLSLVETVPLENRELESHLARLGAPLGGIQDPATERPAEETVVEALVMAHLKPEVARVLPLVLVRNRETLDLERLVRLACDQGEKKSLGFFFELTGRLTGDTFWTLLARPLRDRRVKREESFFRSRRGVGKFQLRAEARNTPALARRWKFRMNMPYESFETLFRKHA